MDLDAAPGAVRFVLVGPRSAGNAGAAARALKNLGYSNLVLVAPRFEPDDPRARRMAVDAADVLQAARVCTDLDEALDGARTVVGTTARTGRHRWPHWPIDRFAPEMARLGRVGEMAVVFGREDSGLTDLELDLCTHLVRLPSSRAYASFNLAQAVLLVAWELRRVERTAADDPSGRPAAGHAEREAMYTHLERALVAIGFLHDDSIEPIMRRFRRLLGRAELTPDEVRMLRGLARQTLWVAGRAGLSDSVEPEAVRGGDEP